MQSAYCAIVTLRFTLQFTELGTYGVSGTNFTYLWKPHQSARIISSIFPSSTFLPSLIHTWTKLFVHLLLFLLPFLLSIFFPSSFRLLKIYLLFFSLLISLFLTCLFTFTFSSSLPRVLFLFPFDSRVIFLTPGFAFSTHVETPGRGDGGAPAARLRRRFAALLALYSTFFTLLSPLPVGSFFLPLPSLQKFDVRW